MVRKKRPISEISLLMLILTCSCWNKYCDAQVAQDDLYLKFERLVQNREKDQALEIGQILFDGIVSEYLGNRNLKNLQKRLEAAENFAKLIIKGLRVRQKRIFLDMSSLDMPLELPSIPSRQEEFIPMLPPAQQLYFANLRLFLNKLNLHEIPSTESKFLQQYYDLKMQGWIEKVANVVTQIMVINPDSSDIIYYSFVLPLLYIAENDADWSETDFLLSAIEVKHLDIMMDFCLLRVEQPKTAVAIAKYQAKSDDRDFSLIDWSFSAIDKCVKHHRPDLAEKLLHTVMDDVDDENKIVGLRLKTAENYSICGDYASAIRISRQTAEDFPESPLYSKVMYSYFAYLVQQPKALQILAEIDQIIEKPHWQRYLPRLIYLKWWALRKTNQHILANETGEQLIKKYGSKPCIAPVLLAHAIDALSEQRYDKCKKLLAHLTKNFPQTNSAKQGQEILGRLNK